MVPPSEAPQATDKAAARQAAASNKEAHLGVAEGKVESHGAAERGADDDGGLPNDLLTERFDLAADLLWPER